MPPSSCKADLLFSSRLQSPIPSVPTGPVVPEPVCPSRCAVDAVVPVEHVLLVSRNVETTPLESVETVVGFVVINYIKVLGVLSTEKVTTTLLTSSGCLGITCMTLASVSGTVATSKEKKEERY